MNAIGSLGHYLLYCELSKEIREKFVTKFILSNNKISSLLNNEVALMITILDPESSLLPDEIRFNWVSSSQIYSLSRDFAYTTFIENLKSSRRNQMKFTSINYYTLYKLLCYCQKCCFITLLLC